MSQINRDPGRGRLLAFSPALAAAVIFFGLLWLLDFPQPMCDDLFYSGAGLNLAQGGDLANPLLVRQGFPGHFFYIYPPIHSYALAGWLDIFGISAGAMTAFQIFLYLVLSVSMVGCLRLSGAPKWLEWKAPLVVTAGFLPFGLRPESLAAALIIAGYLIAELAESGGVALLAGFFLLALGAGTAPRTTLFGIALMAVTLYPRLRRNRVRGGIPRMLLACVGGGLAACLVFCAMVHFQIGEFWKSFHHYSQLVAGSKLMLLKLLFIRYAGITLWPIFPVFLGLLVVAWKEPWTQLKRAGFAIALALPLIGLIGGLGNGTMFFILLGVLFLTASVPRSGKLGLVVSAVVVASLLVANVKFLINLAGIASGGIESRHDYGKTEAAAIVSTPGHPALLDEATARYVFDYRIPKGFIYWPFSAPFLGELPMDTPLRPGDVYILGPNSAEQLHSRQLTDVEPPKWGLKTRRWAFYRHPREAYVFRVDDILKTRGAPSGPAAGSDSPPK